MLMDLIHTGKALILIFIWQRLTSVFRFASFIIVTIIGSFELELVSVSLLHTLIKNENQPINQSNKQTNKQQQQQQQQQQHQQQQ
jgi:hypothetical protein